MIVHFLPNSEIEVTFDLRERTQRRDRPRLKPALDIRFPVTTKTKSRLKSGAVAGFGRLHRGKNRPRRGTKRRVERLGGAIDFLSEEMGLHRTFITLTCPGSSKAAVEAFSAWTGYLLKSLNDWLCLKQQRFSGQKEFYRLHVWELQKRGAEHVHYVCLLSSAVEEKVKEEIRLWYSKVLERVSHLSGVDIFERAGGGGSWQGKPEVLQLKVETVTRSVSAYLSKYLGKAMPHGGRGFSAKLTPRPARLWGASRCLKAAMSRCSISQYFPIQAVEVAPLVCALLELAEKGQRKFSFRTSQSGLMGRARFFFGGDRSSQARAWDEICEILGDESKFISTKERRLPPVIRLMRKANRLIAGNKKRVAFSDLYGTEVYKALYGWTQGDPVDPHLKTLALTCLEDFDEVSLRSSGMVTPGELKKKPTAAQLRLALFR